MFDRGEAEKNFQQLYSYMLRCSVTNGGEPSRDDTEEQGGFITITRTKRKSCDGKSMCTNGRWHKIDNVFLKRKFFKYIESQRHGISISKEHAAETTATRYGSLMTPWLSLLPGLKKISLTPGGHLLAANSLLKMRMQICNKKFFSVGFLNELKKTAKTESLSLPLPEVQMFSTAQILPITEGVETVNSLKFILLETELKNLLTKIVQKRSDFGIQHCASNGN
eukprot:gene2246-2566_t